MKTKALGESLFEIIRSRCISDSSANEAVDDIMKYLNGSCECDKEDMTGYIGIHACNICGRHINENHQRRFKNEN
jgi:hypothetical protein